MISVILIVILTIITVIQGDSIHYYSANFTPIFNRKKAMNSQELCECNGTIKNGCHSTQLINNVKQSQSYDKSAVSFLNSPKLCSK